MALGNRNETQAQVTSELTATVTIAKHTSLLNNDILEGVNYRKDVILNPPVGTGTINFDCFAYDQLLINATDDIIITVTNLEDGDMNKKVVVNKPAANIVSFAGFSGTVDGQHVGLTSLVYRIVSVNSKIYAIQENRQSSGAIAIGDITDLTSIITNTVSFNYRINDNITYINGYVQLTTSAGLSQIGFDITGSQLGSLGSITNYPNSNVLVGVGGIYAQHRMQVDEATTGTYRFRFFEDTGTWASGIYLIYFSGTLFIE